MHYYQRHIGDYAKKAGHLTTFEHGIYTLLLDRYYLKEEPIPDWQAHRIARCTREEVEPVLKEFFEYDEDGDCWRNRRADEEIAAYHARSTISRRNGAKGGRPPGSKNKPKNPDETQPKPDGKAPGSSLARVKKAAKKAAKKKVVAAKPDQTTHSAGFDAFWDAYPAGKRSKKAEAWKVWQRDELEDFAGTIIKDVEDRKAKHWGWIKDGGQFIPGAQVYLNGQRWKDDFEPPPLGGIAAGRRSTVERANVDRASTWAGGDS